MLNDQLNCGIKDKGMSCHLLGKSDLSFQKAFELTQAMKSAEHNVKDLHQSCTGDLHTVAHQHCYRHRSLQLVSSLQIIRPP